MMVFTDGKYAYMVGSYGPNCFRHIEIHPLIDWEMKHGVGYCFSVMRSKHPLFKEFYKKEFHYTVWPTDDDAEYALESVAIQLGWHRVETDEEEIKSIMEDIERL